MHKADNLPPPCAVVTKSENLNFLEPSRHVQACNGTDLLLPFITYSEFVSVTLVIQLFSVTCLGVQYFSTLSHQRHDFRGKKFERKICFFFHVPYIFCLKHSIILRIIQQDVILSYKVPVILVRF